METLYNKVLALLIENYDSLSDDDKHDFIKVLSVGIYVDEETLHYILLMRKIVNYKHIDIEFLASDKMINIIMLSKYHYHENDILVESEYIDITFTLLFNTEGIYELDITSLIFSLNTVIYPDVENINNVWKLQDDVVFQEYNEEYKRKYIFKLMRIIYNDKEFMDVLENIVNNIDIVDNIIYIKYLLNKFMKNSDGMLDIDIELNTDTHTIKDSTSVRFC